MSAAVRFRSSCQILPLLGVFLFPALAFASQAQTGVRIVPRSNAALNAAKIAVRRYCDMDAAGFRLSRETAARMRAVEVIQEMPQWQGFWVIADYQIESARSNSRGILVTVSYRVLGRFELGDGYIPEPNAETVEVQTVADGDEWKLAGDNGSLVRPRIGRARALKWLQEQASAATNPQDRHTLENAIHALQ
jgi:hypothetical protein